MDAAPVRILLVEDSPSDADLLQEALCEDARGEFEFTLAETWAEAAAQLKAKSFDVLLLDLSLPDSAGGRRLCGRASRRRICRSWC